MTLDERLEFSKQVAGNGRGLYGEDILELVRVIEGYRNQKPGKAVIPKHEPKIGG